MQMYETFPSDWINIFNRWSYSMGALKTSPIAGEFSTHESSMLAFLKSEVLLCEAGLSEQLC